MSLRHDDAAVAIGRDRWRRRYCSPSGAFRRDVTITPRVHRCFFHISSGFALSLVVLDVFAQRAGVSVRFVAALVRAYPRFVGAVHERVFLAVGAVRESPLADS